MPDTFVRMKQGEKRPLYGTVTAQSGTLTIAASPAPTCTLYDAAGDAIAGLTDIAAGDAIAGLTDIAVTGYDSGPAASRRAWYVLNTTSPVLLVAGFYTLVFQFTATSSDGIQRVYEPSLEVQVMDVRG